MKKVLGLYFASENSALKAATEIHCKVLGFAGRPAEAIDLARPENVARLGNELAAGAVDFCFGMQGVGSNLRTKTDLSLWTAHQVPFACIHYDSPCHNPFNHISDSPFVGNMYIFESFLDIRERYLPGNQISVAVPYHVFAHVAPVENVFADRPIRLLYLKTGGPLVEHDDYIDALPASVRDGIRQQLERAEKSPNLQLCDLVDEIFIAVGMDRRRQERDFWGVVQTMDIYLRRKRAIDFVNWLKFQEGALIVGDGWDFIDKTSARAIFKSGIDAYNLGDLSRQTKFICNTHPYGRDLIHERVSWGLLEGACVLTDSNAWWDKHFADVPALTRFDWVSPLDEQLQPAIHNPNAAARAATGQPAALNAFINPASIQPLIGLAQKIHEFAG